MDIGAYARRARELAALLLDTLDAQAPHLREIAAGNTPLAPALIALGITVTVAPQSEGGCSVAGSCDRTARSITVVQAAKPRMRFTELHELAHLLGDDHDVFQTRLLELGGTTRRAVEEDACEAFAAALLLPDEVVDAVLDETGVTARGVVELVESSAASREACAVAAAQRLRAPGYVMLVDRDGKAVFTARSGDALPIARSASQAGSVLGPVPLTRTALRERGELLYRGGTRTDLLYVDAVAGPDALLYIVAVTDQPDWDVLHTPDRTRILDRGVDGYCDQCATEFTAWQRCAECGEPRHDVCGTCGCQPAVARGTRTCTECFTQLPARCFPDESSVCEEHPRPR
jgi:hypothetical protein